MFPKYSNKKISHAGYSFASKAEAALFDQLKWLEKAGVLRSIECQDSVYLTDARILYKPDFVAWDVKLESPVWYECKGFETDVYRIKRRLWMHYGPGPLRVFKGSYKSLYLHEEIIPKT
jgi:hypothetical protein